MLSVSFATEACYMIKEINKKIKKSFCRSKSPFCQCKLLLSEMFLDSLFNLLDGWINIEGYNLRIDHPNSNKRWGVCMYFKTFQF